MIQGKGLGLRRELLQGLAEEPLFDLDFLELAPENWIGVGGLRKNYLNQIADKYPLIAHGLCLSIGSSAPLDFDFLKKLKQFLDEYEIELYSDHLSYASDQGQFYDLLPIPFSDEAIIYVSERIRQVQDYLERTIALENISYYADVSINCTEQEFIQSIIKESKCKLLLDVNNVYVNSINQNNDAKQFIKSIRKEDVAYIHVAGHEQLKPTLLLDTHGAAVCDSVWELLSFTYEKLGVIPTLLERDSDIPSIETLLDEVSIIHELQSERAIA